jgi:signal transduction histidine kinase
MALAIGFGLLLTLLVISDLNAVRALSLLQSSNETILKQFLSRQTRLDQLRAAIYLSGTYIRDYLLEPDPNKAERSRLALADTQQQIQRLLSRRGSGPDDRNWDMQRDLQRKIMEYWRALDPVFKWSVQQRHNDGYRFLHDVVLPLRSSTLAIADSIASVNQRQLMERDHRLLQMFSGLRAGLLIAVVGTFLCGLALALATAIHIVRLHARTETHLRQVTEAREELRELSVRLVETQENERKNISRELHDAVGQSMSAVQFELHDLGVALQPYPEPLRRRVEQIRELVESSVAMVRNIALLLRPSMLDDLGLAAALRWQANQVAKSTGLRIEITDDGLPPEPTEAHGICVFRIVQEALSNVSRHARANSVEIKLITRESELCVLIRDDGRGFQTYGRTGLGLIGMQERVENLGGRLAVNSEVGKGTTIEATLPLPRTVISRCASVEQ